MLQQLDEPWSEAHPMVDTLLHDLDAGAAIFAPVKGAQVEWFNEVLERLARDQGLDAAVLEASRTLDLRPPEILAEPRLLAETRLSRVGERLAMSAQERPPAEPESPEARIIVRGIEAALPTGTEAPPPSAQMPGAAVCTDAAARRAQARGETVVAPAPDREATRSSSGAAGRGAARNVGRRRARGGGGAAPSAGGRPGLWPGPRACAGRSA